jgi:hypothetical protein
VSSASDIGKCFSAVSERFQWENRETC